MVTQFIKLTAYYGTDVILYINVNKIESIKSIERNMNNRNGCTIQMKGSNNSKYVVSELADDVAKTIEMMRIKVL